MYANAVAISKLAELAGHDLSVKFSIQKKGSTKAGHDEGGRSQKAEETVTIDLRGKSAFSDYMIVTTGRANRHVGAIAENVAKGLKENGIKSIHVEGLPNCDWVLIDSGDVIVHVFRPEVREFYNLERLWTQGPTAVKAV